MTNGALIALAKKLGGGGGGGSSVTVESLNVTANNTYTAPSGKAYSPVTVNVPDTPAVVAELTATSNGIYTASGGVDGYSPVTVSVAPTITALEATHNGIYTAPSGTDGYSPVTVNVSGGGGGGGSLADQVRFFDYDGTLVDSYSKADFNALSAMPSNPSHTGLTAQGWNWSLAEAKAQLTAMPDGILNIGQMYTTSDGKTRLYIHIDDDTPSNRMTFYVRFKSSVANNVTIDWGDGVTETNGSTTATDYPHTYTTGGDYVIKLTVNSGTILLDGTMTGSGSGIYGSRENANAHNRGRIRKVEIGNNVTSIGETVFQYCYSLTSVTIPNGVTSIGGNAFHSCNSLTSITIPSGVTSIESALFQNCYSLTSVTIPNGVTNIVGITFSSCYSLTSITIPSGVTSIGGSIFQNCYSLTSIIIPSGVTGIGYATFTSCYSITNIIIPSGVTEIGGNAFYQCYSLTNITIPSTVTSIGTSVFYNCYGIAEYHFEPTTPPTITNKNVFTGIASDCKIYVPYSADHSILNAYKTANYWSNYASKMVEESA